MAWTSFDKPAGLFSFSNTGAGKIHPTQKPVELLQRIITAASKPDDIILDVFNGSGTTGVAAAIVGNRRFIGFEIDPNYCELAKQRILNELNNKSFK